VVALAVEDGDDAAHLVRLMNELEFLAVERMKGIVEANLRYISIVLRFDSNLPTLAPEGCQKDQRPHRFCEPDMEERKYKRESEIDYNRHCGRQPAGLTSLGPVIIYHQNWRGPTGAGRRFPRLIRGGTFPPVSLHPVQLSHERYHFDVGGAAGAGQGVAAAGEAAGEVALPDRGILPQISQGFMGETPVFWKSLTWRVASW